MKTNAPYNTFKTDLNRFLIAIVDWQKQGQDAADKADVDTANRYDEDVKDLTDIFNALNPVIIGQLASWSGNWTRLSKTKFPIACTTISPRPPDAVKASRLCRCYWPVRSNILKILQIIGN